MSSTKQEYTKIISYIKHDIVEVETEVNEIKEALGYLNKLPLHQRNLYRSRITKYNNDVAKQETILNKYRKELREFSRDVRFSREEVDRIQPATEEELQRDLMLAERELTNPRADEVKYNKTQHLNIVAYCKELQSKANEINLIPLEQLI